MRPTKAGSWERSPIIATADFTAAYTTSFFVVMNKDKWNSLSQPIQKIIEQINLEWVDKHGEAWDTSDAQGIVFFLNQGGEIIGLGRQGSRKMEKSGCADHFVIMPQI